MNAITKLPKNGTRQDKNSEGFMRHIRQYSENLQKSKKELHAIDDKIMRLLSKGMKGSLLASILPYLPQWSLQYFPESALGDAVGEYNPLEVMEERIRACVNGMAIGLKDIEKTAREENSRLDQLQQDLRRAREEGWDAACLQQYIAIESGIEFDEGVLEILQSMFALLPEEDILRRKNAFLRDLEEVIQSKQKYQEALTALCVAGFMVANYGIKQLFDFVENKRPLIILHDTAEDIAELDNAMFLAKEAVAETFDASVGVIVDALDNVGHLENYSIVSPDMQKRLEEGTKKINGAMLRLVELQKKQDREPLLTFEGLKELEVSRERG